MSDETPLTLHTLKPAEGSHRERKRVGRGHGSGNGKTSGRGHKGQKARSGSHNMRAGCTCGWASYQDRTTGCRCRWGRSARTPRR